MESQGCADIFQCQASRDFGTILQTAVGGVEAVIYPPAHPDGLAEEDLDSVPEADLGSDILSAASSHPFLEHSDGLSSRK